MKGFEFAHVILAAVICAIAVFAFDLTLVLSGGRIEVGASAAPQQRVECKANSDCNTVNGNNPICLRINYQESFCGCLDDSDCKNRKCIYNRCSL